MMQKNNPINMLASMLKSGGDPRVLINQMARNDPQIALAAKMMSGKNAAQLQQMAENMAAEQGISVNDVLRQLGLANPSYR